MKSLKLIALVAVLAGSISTVAAGGLSFKEAKDAINYRQSTFTLVRYQFGDMKGMLKGKKEFNQEQFIMRAQTLATLSHLPWEAFGPGTDKGDTGALPALWKNKADFESRGEKFKENTAALLAAAQSGDKKAMAKAFGAVGKSCKGCHKKYKD